MIKDIKMRIYNAINRLIKVNWALQINNVHDSHTRGTVIQKMMY